MALLSLHETVLRLS